MSEDGKLDPVDLMEQIQKATVWSVALRAPLEEALKITALRSVLREILINSDEMLKNIGMADLTDQKTIQNSLRAQGIAAGLVQAVELILTKATEYEGESNDK